MKNIFCILSLLWLAVQSSAQNLPVINNGVQIGITSNALVFIDGDYFHTNNGSIQNAGDIYLTGNWDNKAGNNAFINSGPANPGKVHLSGANQNISGTDVTHFYKLEAAGTGIKSLSAVDAVVQDSLILNDREFATDTNTLFVTGTGEDLITRTTGFVSSFGNGSLSRNTAAANTYLFPVGSSLGTQRYRPVEITPSSSSTNTYSVRLANNNATTDGYDVLQFEAPPICSINNLYYHHISRTAGTDDADLTVYYDAASDNSFDGLAYWDSPLTGVWNDMGLISPTSSGSLSGYTKTAWNSFSPKYFAFSSLSPSIAATGDTTIEIGESAPLAASGGISYVWSPSEGLDCNTCPNPTATTEVTTTYIVTGTAANGCTATDTVLVKIEGPYNYFVPNIFSPNGDGQNDEIWVMGRGIESVQFSIYDRWGEKIFETNNTSTKWDGTYKGQLLNTEVFVYAIIVKYKNGEEVTGHGNITLLR